LKIFAQNIIKCAKINIFGVVLGFVLGATLPTYLILIPQRGFGSVGEWIGSIATFSAVIVALYQVNEGKEIYKQGQREKADSFRNLKDEVDYLREFLDKKIKNFHDENIEEQPWDYINHAKYNLDNFYLGKINDVCKKIEWLKIESSDDLNNNVNRLKDFIDSYARKNGSWYKPFFDFEIDDKFEDVFISLKTISNECESKIKAIGC